MNKTDRIERIRRDIDQQISYCHNRIDILNKRRNKLIGISKNSLILMPSYQFGMMTLKSG